MTEFSDDTAVQPSGDGTYDVTISGRWSVGTGANGGYIGGLMTRALLASADGRPLRSMTTHYLRPPSAGPAVVTVSPLRAGRSLTVLDAVLSRGDDVIAVTRAAVALPREAPEFNDRRAPDFPPLESIEGEAWEDGEFIRSRYDTRYVTETTGWIRTIDQAPVDAALAVALTDGWIPPVMVRTDRHYGASTIDLTVQLFDAFTHPYDGWCKVINSSSVSKDGYAETSSEVWTADGRLLATGHQLSALFPFPQDMITES